MQVVRAAAGHGGDAGVCGASMGAHERQVVLSPLEDLEAEAGQRSASGLDVSLLGKVKALLQPGSHPVQFLQAHRHRQLQVCRMLCAKRQCLLACLLPRLRASAGRCTCKQTAWGFLTCSIDLWSGGSALWRQRYSLWSSSFQPLVAATQRARPRNDLGSGALVTYTVLCATGAMQAT